MLCITTFARNYAVHLYFCTKLSLQIRIMPMLEVVAERAKRTVYPRSLRPVMDKWVTRTSFQRQWTEPFDVCKALKDSVSEQGNCMRFQSVGYISVLVSLIRFFIPMPDHKKFRRSVHYVYGLDSCQYSLFSSLTGRSHDVAGRSRHLHLFVRASQPANCNLPRRKKPKLLYSRHHFAFRTKVLQVDVHFSLNYKGGARCLASVQIGLAGFASLW